MNEQSGHTDWEAKAVLELVNAATDEALPPIIKAYWAHLNTAAADRIMGQLLRDYADQPDIVDRIRSRRELLDRCRSEGVTSALASGRVQFAAGVFEIVRTYLISESGSALRQIFTDHREILVGAEAQRVLAHLERFNRDDPTLVRRVQERRDLIRVAIDRGTDAAFPVFGSQQLMVDALGRLMEPGNWARKVEIIREEAAVLLTEETDRFLQHLMSAGSDSSGPIPKALRFYKGVLRRARRDGVDSIQFDGGHGRQPAEDLPGDAEQAEMEELQRLIEERFGENSLVREEEIGRLLDEHPRLRPAWERLRPFTLFVDDTDADRVELNRLLEKINTLDPYHERVAAVTLLRRAVELPLVQQQRELWAGFQSDLGNWLLSCPGADRAALLEEALNRTALAETVFTKASHPVSWAQNRWSQGNILTHRMVGSRAGNIERALQCFAEARPILEAVDKPSKNITRWISLGNTYSMRVAGSARENIETALGFLRRALNDTAFQSLDALSQGDALSIFANAMIQRIAGEAADNVEEALHALRQAQSVFSEAGLHDRLGIVHYSLALALLRRRYGDRTMNRREALSNIEACLRLCPKSEWPERWARVQLTGAQIIGEGATRLEHLDTAVEGFRAAQSVFTRTNSPHEWAQVERDLGSTFFTRARMSGRSEDIEAAIRHLQSALDIFGRDTDGLRWSGLHLELGRLHWLRARNGAPDGAERAEEHFRLCLEERPTVAFPREHSQAKTMLAALLAEHSRWDDAHEAFSDSIQAGIAAFETAYTEVGRHAAMASISSLFAEDAYALVRLERYDEALLRLDAGKTRLLSQSLALAHSDLQGLDPRERSQLQDMRRAVHGLEIRMRGDEYAARGATDRGLAAALKEARAGLGNLLDRLRARHPGFMSANLPLPELLALVPPDGALVAPMVTARGTAVFVIPGGCQRVTEEHVLRLDSFDRASLVAILRGDDENGPPAGWFGAYEEQSKAHKAWLDAIDHVGRQMWRAAMMAIHESLVAMGVREGAPVILMPQGGLAVLPMHSAWREVEGARRYFLDDYTVSYAPSGYALSVSRQRLENRDSVASSLLAIINPTGDLTSAQAEGDALEILFGSACTALRRDAATLDAVRRSAPERSHIHFCCHGFYDSQAPMKSALVLAGSDQLTLADVLGTINLTKARLVTLSACETGISDVRRMPDEYVGLPAGFLQAGAAAVISTLWQVDDLSTMLLMERFYQRHIACGQSPAVALRDAQRWLRDATNQELSEQLQPSLAEAPEGVHRSHQQAWRYFSECARGDPEGRPYRHPYYWGAFVLSGM